MRMMPVKPPQPLTSCVLWTNKWWVLTFFSIYTYYTKLLIFFLHFIKKQTMTSFKLDGTEKREVECPFQKMEVRLTIIFSASPHSTSFQFKISKMNLVLPKNRALFFVHLKVMAPLMNGNPHSRNLRMILKKRRNKSYKGVTRWPKERDLRALSCKERSDLSSV